jgi:hypothetical protein
MLVEYAIARLAGLKRLFPPFTTLERMAAGRDGRQMARALMGTVFEPEIAPLAAMGDRETSIPIALRAVNEGSLRLKRFFAARVAEAWPDRKDVFLIRWELEEIKAAMRYLTFGGAGLEKRFRFVSYLMDKKDVWSAHMKPEEFAAALAKAGHPLASAVDPAGLAARPEKTEMEMERFFFTTYLGSHRPALCPSCREYFLDQLDTINAKNAWLLRGAAKERRDRPELFIATGGRIGPGDFTAIAMLPASQAAIALIQERIRLPLDQEKLDSPQGLSTALRNASLIKYRRAYIANPGGVWAFFVFAEEVDAMIADVKNAMYCGATRTAVDVVARRFIGARAS